MTKPYKASAIALSNEFIDLSLQDRTRPRLDHLKLQKLLYYAYGWWAANERGQMLFDEDIYAWRLGPVVERIYQAFKHMGRDALTTYASEVIVDNNGHAQFAQPKVGDLEVKAFIRQIWDTYGEYTGIQLANLSHEVGGPWHEMWTKSGNSGTAKIPHQLIENYFVNWLERSALDNAKELA